MSKYNLDAEKLNDEKNLQQKIFSMIDMHKSFAFKAGAGVGKTYALIESIKYILNKYYRRFVNTGEKVRVITFTNTATNEIINRIGENNNIVCSTIHKFAWEIISNYPKELLSIHLEEIEEEISKKEVKISYPLFSEYLKTHSSEEIKDFQEKEGFYELKGAQNIKNFFGFTGGNATKFYDAIKAYISKKNLNNTKEKIEKYLSEVNGRIKSEFLVKYDVNSNVKNLNKMRIDHELCLKYYRKLFNKYNLLKKIISYKYPFLLIDEYQDTDELIITSVSDMIKDPNCDIVIGFYGDEIQNIYIKCSDSVNKLIEDKSIECIYKKYNRRCSSQVINVGNKINKLYEQESIYTNHDDGEIRIINLLDKSIEAVLNNLKSYGKIDCLILKNETIAEKIGISNLYQFYKNTREYSGHNYDKLNTELLHHDIEKLGETQSLIFSIIKLYMYINDENCYLSEIFANNYNLRRNECFEIILKLKKIKESINEKTTFEEFLKMIFSILDISNNSTKSIKKRIFGIEYNLEDIKQLFSNKFTPEDLSIYDIKVEEFFKWYQYITQNQKADIRYHTYHNTKGLEYENVAIVIEDKFRIEGDILEFLKNLINAIKNNNYNLVNENQTLRNLFYVAVTRSKKNLFIINNSSLSDNELITIFS